MMVEEDKDLIRNMLNAYFRKHTRNGASLIDAKIKDIYKCCKKKHLVSFFSLRFMQRAEVANMRDSRPRATTIN